MAQDLKVITKAKELAELVYEITERSPKKFRFTIVGLMQNLSLGIVDELYKANDVYVETQYTRELKNDVEELKHNCGDGTERLYRDAKLTMIQLERHRILAARAEERAGHSQAAMLKLRELDWLVSLGARTQCITRKQQERLARVIYEERALIGGFIRSDRQRFRI